MKYVWFFMQAYLARLNLEKDLFKVENETIYSTNDHLWRSRLSKNWKYPAVEEESTSHNKQREEQRDSNILFYNPWVFDIACCNDNAIFVWFSLICLESLGFL